MVLLGDQSECQVIRFICRQIWELPFCHFHRLILPLKNHDLRNMEMIRAGEVREDDETYKSALDILFERLEMRNPEHIALKYYRSYHSGSGKTLKSIQITLISRLEKFNLESLASITQNDELELWSIGEKKTAVFAIIPDNDSSFSFLVGMLYTQLFQQLYYQADVIHGGWLPVHVHFLMDEFANVALPDEFDKLLSTMRSREISVSIIIQNLAQLKALFESYRPSRRICRRRCARYRRQASSGQRRTRPRRTAPRRP